MHRALFDWHRRIDSPIHRLPAAGKLLAAVALIVAVVALPPRHAVHLVWPALVLGVAAGASRLPVLLILKRLALLEPFVLGVAAMSLLQPGGWRIFVILLAKCTLCLLAAILLSGTTAFADLLRVLRSVHVPSLLVTTLALMHRYLFVLADESQRMRRARASRTFVARRWWQWRALATVAGQLFIRASERAERVYAAMCARGWK